METGALVVLDALGDLVVLCNQSGRVLYMNGAVAEIFGDDSDSWRLHSIDQLGLTVNDVRSYVGQTGVVGVAYTPQGVVQVEWGISALPDGKFVLCGRNRDAVDEGQLSLFDALDASTAGDVEVEAPLLFAKRDLWLQAESMINLAEALDRSVLSPHQHAQLSALSAGARQIIRLADRLGSPHGPEQYLNPGALDSMNLIDAVLDAVRSLSPHASDNALTLAAVLDPCVPERVEADGGYVRQLMLNLTNAAIGEARSGGVTVSLHCENPGQDTAHILIAIKYGCEDAEDQTVEAPSTPTGKMTSFEGVSDAGPSDLDRAREALDALGSNLEISQLPTGGGEFRARLRFKALQHAPTRCANGLDGVRMAIATPNLVLRHALAQQATCLGADLVIPQKVQELRDGLNVDVLCVDERWMDRSLADARHEPPVVTVYDDFSATIARRPAGGALPPLAAPDVFLRSVLQALKVSHSR